MLPVIARFVHTVTSRLGTLRLEIVRHGDLLFLRGPGINRLPDVLWESLTFLERHALDAFPEEPPPHQTWRARQ
jgi:hypothetical protein